MLRQEFLYLVELLFVDLLVQLRQAHSDSAPWLFMVSISKSLDDIVLPPIQESHLAISIHRSKISSLQFLAPSILFWHEPQSVWSMRFALDFVHSYSLPYLYSILLAPSKECPRVLRGWLYFLTDFSFLSPSLFPSLIVFAFSSRFFLIGLQPQLAHWLCELFFPFQSCLLSSLAYRIAVAAVEGPSIAEKQALSQLMRAFSHPELLGQLLLLLSPPKGIFSHIFPCYSSQILLVPFF